ncbi:pentapeptide repeat-containing protein [Nocardiopsis aegyptia]|uniref:Uncharacterized protein YjbI with pentapeptide repeats n=1 Tax=Nocardiopsis aegyptia TaxID=220378 RepID=A0A7Z0EI11_9ACTN|nr:pentapeptide repeat-containing protein [Nocardiopsis aegyptia]NYJ32366.1 uncharacterized protein YjbI with pentapeptide repeats [Nocardiopsis aegyptia]
MGALIPMAWAVVISVVTALAAGAWWLMGAPTLVRPNQLTPGTLDAIATRSFAVVAGLGAAALLVISYRRQHATEAEGERENTKLFTERFTVATAQLGDAEPAIRLAGVHALANLADDAPEGKDELVQMVVDVLCAYLRMPYEPLPKPLPDDADPELAETRRKRELWFASLREVRHTVIRIIGNHLRTDTRWRGKDYDFTGVSFDGGELKGARFSGGRVSFEGAQFAGGQVSFEGASFSGGRVSFEGAQFTGGQVTFSDAEFCGGRVYFTSAEFGGGDVPFASARVTGGLLDFTDARFTDGQVYFIGTDFSGGRVDFDGTRFTGSEVYFVGAEFADNTVSFHSTRFSGGNVTFADLASGMHDASGMCPEGLFEAVERGEPGVVELSPLWASAADSGDCSPCLGTSVEDSES